MAFSIAVPAKPRGAARPCSHSCNVRFEICNFNAATLAKAKEKYRTRRLGEVAVKGKQIQTEIFALLG